MKAEELRIGNYVKFGGVEFVTGQIAGVYDTAYIDFEGCESLNKGMEISSLESDFDEYLQPIPLSEDWLLKFGFVKNDYPYDDYVSPPFGLGMNIIKISKDMEFFIFKLSYVHQLQNLYFALTGEELTIKEVWHQ